ncbi:MAG: NUDIX domain-containing protein [Fimbriimonas sp.]
METLGTRLVYENKWLRLREDRIRREDGSEGIYSVVEKRPCAMIIPWDGERLTLIEQFRQPLGARYWEFPSGALDVEDGSDEPEEIARTELRQETGLLAGRMTPLGSFYIAPGITNQICHVFLAQDLVAGDSDREAEEVGLEVGSFTLHELEELRKQGKLVDGLTLAALHLWRS